MQSEIQRHHFVLNDLQLHCSLHLLKVRLPSARKISAGTGNKGRKDFFAVIVVITLISHRLEFMDLNVGPGYINVIGTPYTLSYFQN